VTRPIFTYTVAPSLPPELDRLRDLAYNLLWAWDHELIELFRRLDRDLWEETNHNPVRMLGSIRQDRLEAAARDDAFLAQLDRAYEHLQDYMGTRMNWCQKTHDISCDGPCIAYFSAEFGLTECVPNYSGGLGILSGDHLKSASDLGVPLVGVGLLYQQGYFRQYLNADGWQQERYPDNDFYTLPIQLKRGADGKPVTVTVEYPGRNVVAQVWQVQVGRVPLCLLDTNVPTNSVEDQNITDQLYGGDREMRIKQEIMLGIGGYRALRAVGAQPVVFHINEGHAAFLSLEHCRALMREQVVSFAYAREAAMTSTVFTTHTPVPAGNDYFAPELIDRYLTGFSKELGLSRHDFLGLGRQNPDNDREDYCMTVLALRMAGYSNGVSRMHGAVSRKMWQNIWPGVPVQDTPITSITNGVHAPSWISGDMAGLFDRYLGPRWRQDPGDAALWQRVHKIPDEELWRTHERRRERLVAFARGRLRAQLEARGAPPSEVAQAEQVLNPEALTIGFARRFATYKRATLLLRDAERLARILNDRDRPVQVIFAGKAHPLDNPGKELIRQIIHYERRPDVRSHMVFIEDYDMVVARYLVQGVDVWLNTPRRPLEASGTSGMKATLNGAINVSTLDGWWAEAYNVNAGWAIGSGEEYGDAAYQDEVESNALYDLLEKEIAPLFYTRGSDGLPRAWISHMKTAMRALCPVFNTSRMVCQYTEEFYLPALKRYQSLSDNHMERAGALALWRARVRQGWASLEIMEVKADLQDGMKVGDTLAIHAWVDLGALEPEDVAVELYQGQLDAGGEILWPQVVPMSPTGQAQGTRHEFAGAISTRTSGRHGYTVRVLPRHPDLGDPYREGLILWA
jgi:glycogen phosphorylase